MTKLKLREKKETKFSVFIDGIHESLKIDRTVPLLVEVDRNSKKMEYETFFDGNGYFHCRVTNLIFNVKITVDEELSAYDEMRITENYFEVTFDRKERLVIVFDVVYSEQYTMNFYEVELDLDGPKDSPDFLFLDMDDNTISIR
jgi:hypothetical protein